MSKFNMEWSLINNKCSHQKLCTWGEFVCVFLSKTNSIYLGLAMHNAKYLPLSTPSHEMGVSGKKGTYVDDNKKCSSKHNNERGL